ncbi:saccharopine dehydrogenase family protein [Rhodococcus sp. NCIMB 12038]|uniref:saccharopine dehydrogenase family protein n=1 Tax=Rhodococcus sp. NCIMB 12038 TaxID=933800 RepID=UPI000B3CEB78|nr:saccharopine dehydrogenase NADP-binding domain-containing protein [Rhodococcus sp. NCIMB 12038]OUS89662.1 hypothetical protein CA951_36300 [Rhodococcus sp. NCIMB 12038]
MNVVVIGGAGRVGARVVSELAKVSDANIVIADRNKPRDGSFEFVELDLADGESLRRAVRGAQVVVNTSGPFDRWGTVVLDAAIECGVDYIDVCDDPAPTIELLKRDEAARNAGVRAVVGLGISPGMSNLLAVVAARQLDSVDLLTTFWGRPGDGKDLDEATEFANSMASAFEGGRAAFTHLIAQAAAEIPVWRNGAAAYEPAWRAAYRVTTSDGETGLYRVIGHPEPVTLPHTVASRDCINIGTIEEGADRLLLPYLDRVGAGELSETEALGAIAADLRAHPEKLVTERVGDPIKAFVGVAATGEKDGAQTGIVVLPGGSVDGSMSLETARPAVVGVLVLSDVPVGVHSPETAFDPDKYLTAYSDTYWGGAEAYVVDVAGPTAVERVE